MLDDRDKQVNRGVTVPARGPSGVIRRERPVGFVDQDAVEPANDYLRRLAAVRICLARKLVPFVGRRLPWLGCLKLAWQLVRTAEIE